MTCGGGRRMRGLQCYTGATNAPQAERGPKVLWHKLSRWDVEIIIVTFGLV